MRQTCGVTEANRVCEHITPEMKEAAKVASKTTLEIVLIRFWLTDGVGADCHAEPCSEVLPQPGAIDQANVCRR